MKIYAYGDLSCRGDVQVIRVALDSDKVLEGIVLVEDHTNDERTDAELDKFFNQFSRHTSMVLDLFWAETTPARNLYNKIMNGNNVFMLGEETLFGYSLTKNGAMAAYANGMHELGGNEDGDWENE